MPPFCDANVTHDEIYSDMDRNTVILKDLLALAASGDD